MTDTIARAGRRAALALGLLTLAVAVTAVAATAGTAAKGAAAATPLKIAFIYIGPRADAGWTQAHDVGRLQVEKAFPGKVTTVYKENVPESPQSAQVIESLIQDGAKVIVATSYGYHTYTLAAAKKHPDVKFFQMESNEKAPNLTQYHGGLEDAYYLAGMAAASISKSGKLGMSAEFPIPNVINFANGFLLGIRAINPKATLRVVWTNSWYDPPKEGVAAKGLVSSNVDFMSQNQNSPTTGQVAEKAKLPFVGSFWRQKAYAPTQYLTSAIFTWGPWYIKQVRQILNGSWKSGQFYLTYRDKAVALDAWGPQYKKVPASVKAKIKAVEKQLKAGTFDIYTGPMKDTNGKVRLKEGETLPLEGRYSVSWFPEGILTNVKSK
jgi:basic membrane protein A